MLGRLIHLLDIHCEVIGHFIGAQGEGFSPYVSWVGAIEQIHRGFDFFGFFSSGLRDCLVDDSLLGGGNVVIFVNIIKHFVTLLGDYTTS